MRGGPSFHSRPAAPLHQSPADRPSRNRPPAFRLFHLDFTSTSHKFNLFQIDTVVAPHLDRLALERFVHAVLGDRASPGQAMSLRETSRWREALGDHPTRLTRIAANTLPLRFRAMPLPPPRRARATSVENPFASFYESRRKISLETDD